MKVIHIMTPEGPQKMAWVNGALLRLEELHGEPDILSDCLRLRLQLALATVRNPPKAKWLASSRN